MILINKKRKMSAKEQVFSKKVQKASAGHYYIHISKDAEGKTKTSNIKLSGFRQMFERDSQFIYNPALRVAGREEVLLEYLISLGYSEKDVLAYLKESYTLSNCNTRFGEIEREIQSIPAPVKEEKKQISLDEIIRLRPLLDTAKVSGKAVESETSPSEMTSFKSKSRNDLKSRLEGIEDEKVLDISLFDVAKGKGVKTTKRTTNGTRRPLASSGLLNRVVFDFSKDSNIAVQALVSLGMTQSASETAVNSALSSAKTASLDKIAVSRK
jgi:hypothetical protein